MESGSESFLSGGSSCPALCLLYLRVIFVQAKGNTFLAWGLRFPSWEPFHTKVTLMFPKWLQTLTSLLLPR